jgi:protein-disulfide isomerase
VGSVFAGKINVLQKNQFIEVISYHLADSECRQDLRSQFMKRRFFNYCGVVSLLAVQVALGVPMIASAQTPPPIAAETEKRIVNEPGVPIVGAANADVTVVEYFDYNCPFCKALAPVFHPFLAQDHAAAVLYKEWPIFGGVSIYAAQAALAANYQGKYLLAHDALIGAPRLGENSQVDAALRAAGIDMAQLRKDLVAHRASIDQLLMRNDNEARGLGLRGTPGILVGRRIVSGISDLPALQSAVALSRHPAKKQ